MLHPPMCLSHNYICSHEEDNSTNILWLQPLLYQNDVFSVNKVLQFTGIPANCNFAAPFKFCCAKGGLLTPESRSYAPKQQGV